jgi:predicted ABC-type ATPase
MRQKPAAFLSESVHESDRFLIVLAGSNGAGKSTFFTQVLAPLGVHFVNADLLARELNPDDPSSVAYEAAALADQERRQLLEMGESFCMETVFSDPVGDKLGFLKKARAAGYRVLLIFIGIVSPELSEARVIQRVSEGGHDVPDDRIRSRFPRTLENLRRAIPIVDEVLLLDNSSLDDPYTFVAQYQNGRLVAASGRAYAWTMGLPDITAP